MAAADDDRNYRREDDRGSEDPDRKGWPRLEFHDRETVGECGRGRVGRRDCETRDPSGSVAEGPSERRVLRSEDQLRAEPGRVVFCSRRPMGGVGVASVFTNASHSEAATKELEQRQ